MASSTGHSGAVSRETYWKRRAFVLVGIMLVFAVITYACRPSAGDDGEPSRSDAGIGATEEPSPSVAPEEPTASASDEPEDEESPGADEDDGDKEDDGSEGDSGGGGDGGDSRDGGDGGDSGGSSEIPAPERPEDACRPQDVVVTFDFSEKDKEVYGAGTDPAFRITVVNTAEQTCTVDVGGESMEIRIRSGDDRIFSSADCVEGEGAEERQLSRGVPHEYTFTWERDRSFTDCRDKSSAARAGWYRANLHGEYSGGAGQLPFQLKA